MRTLLAFALLVIGCGTDSTAPPDGAAADLASAGDLGAGPDLAACATVPADTVVDVGGGELTVAGETAMDGIFDPSIVYPKGAPLGLLAYSHIPSPALVETRLAASNDLGKSWTLVGAPNQVANVTVPTSDTNVCGASSCMGALVHEVPSLIVDPTDPDPNRLLKLFVHSYPVIPNGKPSPLQYAWGYIGLQTAAKADTWSAETKLLGWSSTSPLSSSGAAQVLTDVPALADCVAFSEPGALVRSNGAIDLALGCVSDPLAPKIRIVLLRSVDHAASFQYVGVMLSGDDASCVGADVPRFNGADLFTVGGVEYLSATTSDSAGGYRRCMTFLVDDPDAGHLARDGGALRVLRSIAAPGGRFLGACAYAEGATATGYLGDEGFLGQTPGFRIFASTTAAP